MEIETGACIQAWLSSKNKEGSQARGGGCACMEGSVHAKMGQMAGIRQEECISGKSTCKRKYKTENENCKRYVQ